MRNCIVLCLISFTLFACSSKKPIDPMEFAGQFKDSFSTQIKGDGIKLFVYKAKLATATDRDLSRRPTPEPKRRQDVQSYLREIELREELLEQWHDQVQLGLDNTIKMTGYCKEGYMELSRFVEPERAEIRGECNDGATEQDIAKFGS